MQSIEELNSWLAEHHMAGLWAGAPRESRLTPYLWKWHEIEQGVKAAGQLVPMDTAGRRTINVRHPLFPDRMTNSIHMSFQCVMPGEVATAHRHNLAAIRFIIKGSPKAYTVVEGEPMPMETGDLITTPGWTWHDHHNEGDEPVIWLDGLDVRLVTATWHVLWQELGDARQPVTKPTGYGQRVRGHTRPLWMQEDDLPTPPMRYPWSETEATFAALKNTEQGNAPCDGIRLSFTHARTGGPTLPTIGCELQLLTPQQRLAAHRHLSTAIYYVVRGSGATIVDDETLTWSQGDVFLVPPWSVHRHENRSLEDAILFSMNDAPMTVAAGLYREEILSS